MLPIFKIRPTIGTTSQFVSRTLPQVHKFTRLQSTTSAPENTSAPQYADSLLDSDPVQTTPTATLDPAEKPIPKSLQLIYRPPLKHPVKYGDLVADIQLRSYEHKYLDFYVNFIQRVAYYLGAPMTGPKPLPTRRERWTVIRSPFVHAKSKENFERHTHKRLLRVWDTTDEVLELLVSYAKKHAMTGVGMKVNVYKREPIFIDFDKDVESAAADVQKWVGSGPAEQDLVNAKVLELLKSENFK